MPRRSRWLIACLLTLSLVRPLAAQGIAQHPRVVQAIQLLRLWLDAQRDYQQLPGVSAAVVHDQELVWSGGFGYADRERKQPATPSTIYSICSISKLFTSIAVMRERDAGRLRLDDSVAQHLPWFRIQRSDSVGPEVTVEGLLTHASGIPREADAPYWTGPDFVFPTREQIIERLSRQTTLQEAETYFQYSNLGLTLAGEIVAATSGELYAQYVRGHILAPIGLANTTPEMPADQRGKRLAVGYTSIQRDGRRNPVAFFTTKGIAPAAGYASTVEDLGRFASWQFRVLARKGGEDILQTNTLREMQRVHWIDPDFETIWGLGFAIWRNKEKTFVGHGGSCPGFRSQLLLKPDEQVATVIMVNAQGVNTGAFTQQMYAIMAPAIKAAASDTAPVRPADTTFARYAGTYDLGFAGETAVIPWQDGLAAVDFPTMDPMGEMDRFKKVSEHTFRRVRKDDTLAETVVFEIGADGQATGMRWHQNTYRRVR